MPGGIVDIVIRRAHKSDFDQVGRVFAGELAFHSDLMPGIFQMADPVMTREWYEEALADPANALFLADLEEEIIGLLLLKVMTSPDDPIYRPRCYVYVDELAVLEPYRGLGVGRQLMVRAREWAVAQGATEIQLDVWQANTRAIGFYEALGYQPVRKTMTLKLD